MKTHRPTTESEPIHDKVKSIQRDGNPKGDLFGEVIVFYWRTWNSPK